MLVASTSNRADFRVKVTFETVKLSAGFRTVTDAVCVRPPKLTETGVAASAVTGFSVTTNVPELEPAGIVIEAGKVTTAGFQLDNATTAVALAGPVRVTVPVTLKMPYWPAGLIEKPVRVYGATRSRRVVWVTPLAEAERFANVAALTAVVVT